MDTLVIRRLPLKMWSYSPSTPAKRPPVPSPSLFRGVSREDSALVGRDLRDAAQRMSRKRPSLIMFSIGPPMMTKTKPTILSPPSYSGRGDCLPDWSVHAMRQHVAVMRGLSLERPQLYPPQFSGGE